MPSVKNISPSIEPGYKEPELCEVPVTEDDIANGKPKDPCDCPIARALNRHFPGHEFQVMTYEGFLGNTLSIGLKGSRPGGTLFSPRECEPANFVRDFDKGLEVNPIKVKVRADLPDLLALRGLAVTQFLKERGENDNVGGICPSR